MNHEKSKAKFSLIVKCILNHAIQLFKALLFVRKKILDSPNRILIYRIGQIGDIICSIPAIIAVREYFPGAHITLLTTPVGRYMPGAKELLDGADFLEEIIVYYHNEFKNWRGILSFVRKLRQNRYDIFIELPNDLGTFRIFLRDMVFAKLIGCKYAFGFQINTLKIFLKQQAEYITFKGEVERLLGILTNEGFTVDSVKFSLPIARQDVFLVDNLFEEYRVRRDDLCVAINPGAKRLSNRWPKERFITVGKTLKEYYGTKLKIWIIGGKGDVELAQSIAIDIGSEAFSIAGRSSILQTAELLRRCRLIITNDTGPMHLANAVGTKIIAIISPWQLPGKWYPYGDDHFIFRGSSDCELCYRFDCSLTKCTENVLPENIINACKKILSDNTQCAESVVS